MYRVTNLTDTEIRKIGDAYADYTYSEGEVGMTLVYKDRQAVSDYICGFVSGKIGERIGFGFLNEHFGNIKIQLGSQCLKLIDRRRVLPALKV